MFVNSMFGMTVSELQSFQLWDICWPSTIKPRWLTPDHHLASFEVLIWMDHAGLHIESFSTPSPWSFCSAFPLPPYKNLCLHWGVKMVFEAWNCHLLRLLAPQIKPLSFSPAPTSQIWLLLQQAAGPVFGYIITTCCNKMMWMWSLSKYLIGL